MIRTTAAGYDIPEFAVYAPSPAERTQRRHVPVAIVGGGLTGLTLACDLTGRNVPFVLFDDDNTVGVRGASSRGIVYAQKSLEIFARLGVYEQIAAKGVAWSVGRSLVEDETIYLFDAAERNVSCQPPFVNIQQFYVEWALAGRLQQHSQADIRWGNKAVAAREEDGTVILAIESAAGGYEVAADWVVDCAGVNSTLRNWLHLPTYPAKGSERWLICDVRFRSDLPSERRTWIRSRVNDGRAIWQHPMADDVWRIDFQLDDGADPEDFATVESCRRQLTRLLGEDVAFDIVWWGPWSSRTHLLDDFRVGRILFAGDAAHGFSPFGARGGNSGIQDADNLGWKLALVVSGGASPRLLDSYNAERRPAAVHNTKVATRSLSFVSPKTAQARMAQDALIALARRFPFARKLVNTGRLSEAFTYAPSEFLASGGYSVPNVALQFGSGDKGELVDLFRQDTKFVLFFRHDAAPRRAVQHKCLKAYSVGSGADCDLVDIDGEFGRSLGLDEHEAVLLRPDMHVAALIGRSTPEACMEALERALGIGPAPQLGRCDRHADVADADAIYHAFVAAHEGLTERESAELTMRLCFLLAGEVGDPSAVVACIRKALTTG